jgi:hypothetical protein
LHRKQKGRSEVVAIAVRHERSAVGFGKTSYGADWRQQSKVRSQVRSMFLTTEMDAKNHL